MKLSETKSWMIGSVRVYAWPFVMVIVVTLAAYGFDTYIL